MADGISCKRCGHCETDHDEMNCEEDATKIRPGYEINLITCGPHGYDPETQPKQEENKK
ncbi:MAG: hypothetical protein NTY04_00235 [Candidatus Staskawiczbacteria bacterium]|nr:hypothetical protein [Candidatus Staskawiczbacteria bacterium]